MKMRLRSQRVVQDVGLAADVDKNEGPGLALISGWANLPNELLRLVLERIEKEESKWPVRKHVVACAGVCKGWREILKELVKPPMISGSLTFPISVKQPGPRDSLLQCFIRRKNSSQTYHLYLSLNQALADDGKFILTARKCRRTTCTEYIITLLTDDMLKGSKTYLGKLRSNFLGTKFVVYDALPPSGASTSPATNNQPSSSSSQASPRAIAGNYPVSHVSYELNVLGARRGPRRMHVVMDPIPASSVKPDGVAPTQLEFPLNSSTDHFSMFRSKSSRQDKSISGPLSETDAGEKPLVLRNKNPRWHEQLQCWCLNFHGRVTVASVKNFQLVASAEGGEAGPEYDKVILQFGKVGKDVFTMDYKYPLSAFQAFAICLSSFDTKIACE